MSTSKGMRIFVSWSGELAKDVAIELRALLPVVFDGVTPWVSDRDIQPGGRSMQAIARQLDDTAFGIIVTTRENQDAPWLNFEAGALSKRFGAEHDSPVVPLLVDMESIAELTGPLTQFQAKVLDREGLLDLLISIGTMLEVKPEVVTRRLSSEWDSFERQVETSKSRRRHPSQQPKRSVESMVEESLELVRVLAASIPVPRLNRPLLNEAFESRPDDDSRQRTVAAVYDNVIHKFPDATVQFADYGKKGLHLTIDGEGLSNPEFWPSVFAYARDRSLALRVVANGKEVPPF